MVFVTEIMDTQDVELVAEYADILQVGARNMQNFAPLQEVGQAGKPVLLKQGLAATEWFYAAEYILAQGNGEVILVGRGICTYERWTRNTLDLSAVALDKGADGVHVEVHPNPKVALSDNEQQAFLEAISPFLRR